MMMSWCNTQRDQLSYLSN